MRRRPTAISGFPRWYPGWPHHGRGTGRPRYCNRAAGIKVSIKFFLTTRYLITPETIIVIRQRFFNNKCRDANRSLLPNTSSTVFMIIYPSNTKLQFLLSRYNNEYGTKGGIIRKWSVARTTSLFIPVKKLFLHFKVFYRRLPRHQENILPNPCNLKVVWNAFTLLNWS